MSSMTLDAPPVREPEAGWTLASLFRTYRSRVLITYLLFTLENLARLAQPFVLGLAIDDLLHASSRGLLLFIAQHMTYLLVSAGRRAYDSRAFTSIYADLASRLVLEQRARQVPVSLVAARTALSREIVNFFERDLVVVLHVLYSVVGALVMVCLFDPGLLPWCLALIVPVCLVNRAYGHWSFRQNARLHDQLEREVDVIGSAGPAEVRGHFHLLGRWRVKLADGEAWAFGVTELFVLGLLGLTLVRACATTGVEAGQIFAIFRYVLMFIAGLDGVPQLVQQLSRLRDISRRLQQPI